MGNYDEDVKKPLSEVTGPLLGQVLLPKFKEQMKEQKVFRMLFGKDCERVYVDELPSYNDTIIPLLEMRWSSESWQSKNTRVSGMINGMLILPADMLGRTDQFREIAAAFARWIESRHNLFKEVPGLIECGKNITFKYDDAVKADATTFPIVRFTLPVLFDLQKFRLRLDDIDLDAPLDAPRIPDITTYSITITDENLNVLIPTGILLQTEPECEDEDDG